MLVNQAYRDVEFGAVEAVRRSVHVHFVVESGSAETYEGFPFLCVYLGDISYGFK